MIIIWTIIKLLIVLGIVATIHEFGHFLFAKIFKITVNEFSIGFGPKIIQKKFRGTMYSLRCIPLGGYVSLEGEDSESDDKNAFCNQPCIKRIVVLLAGVTFNAILAILLFLGVNLSTNTFGTKVSKIDESSVAYISGLREGDTITKIGEKKVHIYQDVALYNDLENDDITLEFLRDGKYETILLKNVVKEIGYIGVYFDSNKKDENGNTLTYVDMIEPGMPASDGKIKANDKILSIDGTQTLYSSQVIEVVSNNPNKEIKIVVLRGEEEVELLVTPTVKKSFDLGKIEFKKENTTLKYSYYKSISTISQIVDSYINLFKGKVAIKQLSGIVGIGEVVSKTEGVAEFLSMLAMISLAVGIANVLPFPPLDGGKVVLVLFEWISRKKVPLKLELILSYIGFGLLILLTIFVTVNDIIRLV